MADADDEERRRRATELLAQVELGDWSVLEDRPDAGRSA